jgi:N-acetylglucosamine-6-phosphate deacetylase
MATFITHAHLVSPDVERFDATLELHEGRIRRILSADAPLPPGGTVFDAAGKLVVPGFIDEHCHGGMGYEVTGDDPRGMACIGEAKLKEGVTAFCPTTLTLPEEKLAASMRHIEAYRRAPSGCKVIGTHLEGPYINPQCTGAQNPAYLRQPDLAEVMRLHAISPVALVTYAIEGQGCLAFTRELARTGIRGSCGHSDATYAQFKEAMPLGLKRLTHFCNQMTKLHHREIGLVGAGLLEDEVAIEMICDKIHLCPDMIRLAFHAKPVGRILLITDAMEATGLPDGTYQLGGLAVTVSDGAARLSSNGALAGSTLQFNAAFRNAAEVTGLPLPELVKTTSWNQAGDLGITDMGRLEPGFVADIVVLDETFNVAAVFLDGVRRV